MTYKPQTSSNLFGLVLKLAVASLHQFACGTCKLHVCCIPVQKFKRLEAATQNSQGAAHKREAIDISPCIYMHMCLG
jgi:hypothetical protein